MIINGYEVKIKAADGFGNRMVFVDGQLVGYTRQVEGRTRSWWVLVSPGGESKKHTLRDVREHVARGYYDGRDKA